MLDRIEQLPAVMAITQLLQQHSGPHPVASSTSSHDQKDDQSSEDLPALTMAASSSSPQRVSIDALRLIELTERTSAVLKSQEADFLLHSDSVLSIFRTFGFLNRMSVSTSLSVVGYDEFSTTVVQHAQDTLSQMVIIPWKAAPSTVEPAAEGVAVVSKPGFNPFENMFKTSGDQPSSRVQSQFIRKVFAETSTDVALIIDRGLLTGDVLDQHIFLPFFGGPDDRIALAFLVQLCTSGNISATVVRMRKSEDLSRTSTIDSVVEEKLHATIISQHNVRSLA